MSSWERARSIPWDRIPHDGSNLDEQKERIFRDLQREAIEGELQQQERHDNAPTVEGAIVAEAGGATEAKKQQKFPYSNMEVLRQAAFGGTIGTITGGVFGMLDGMRAAGESTLLKNASDAAKARYIFEGTTRNATLFGVFFAGFHVFKYGLRVVSNDELGPYSETAIAAPVSVGILAYNPAWRPAVPYGCMLIGMDMFQNYMKRN
eukprot:CAMPEP_0172441998 /NCGR_PEP_ID=MMETSP1065-20121228/2481_1 /TAXON_ID=265537 /ORGANISM="Amphiprora paludosa, Strain CCMP125" /LENGTH=205 /DNA_ID=CAMNT_0013191641 /DNA_START=194 /DNA_END=811 /DNA_ORIENTATION=-